MSTTLAEPIGNPTEESITAAATFAQPKKHPKPFLLRFRASKQFILLTVGLALFTDIVVYGILIPVMPFIVEGINSGTGYNPNINPYTISTNSATTARDTGILIALYAAGLLGASPLFGILGDRTSTRQYPMLLGIFGLILSTLILMFAAQYWLLLVARFFQGISAACVWTLGLTLVADTIPSKDLAIEMGKIMISYSVGMLAGPPIGGVLYANLGPKSPFIFCIIIAVVDFVFRLLIVEKRNSPKEWFENGDVETAAAVPAELSISEKLDVPIKAAVPDAADSGIILYSHSADNFTETVVGVDIANECKADKAGETLSASSETVVPTYNKIQMLTLIFKPRMIMALVVTMANSFLYGALEPTLTLRLATEWGLNTGQIGLVFISQIAPGFFFGPGAGWFSDWYGPKIVVLVNMVLTAICSLLLALPNEHTGLGPLIVLLILIGGASAAFLTPVLAEIVVVVNAQGGREGDGFARSYGIFNMAFSLGCLIGPIGAGVIYGEYNFFWVTFMIAMLIITIVPGVYLYTGGRGPLIQRKEIIPQS
ncbi:major facilitator superfamily domain-containing protein [Endogone sp. FLAS-F59071]|nr:major facilitator superfamily domain-containing protein [Endogone sp. FLAS-F59071]|eukprot:RUS21766.1 major facilitator superfamily domain-containing protein [Endogone sp. FLAS-F59071]